MEEKTKAGSVYKIGYRLIWCTKYRKDIIVGTVEYELREIIHQTAKHYGWQISEYESVSDHVQMIVETSPEYSPREIAQVLKSISAATLFKGNSDLKKRSFWGSGLWSKSTYYGTVGDMSESVIKKYIENQKKGRGEPPPSQA